MRSIREKNRGGKHGRLGGRDERRGNVVFDIHMLGLNFGTYCIVFVYLCVCVFADMIFCTSSTSSASVKHFCI